MSTQDGNSLEAKINGVAGMIGNQVITPSSGAVGTASTPLFVDSSSKVAQGNIPFAFPLAAGSTDTSFSALSVIGSSTLTANDIMHQTLVAGSGVTTFTSAGFIRVSVTDNAGNITNGSYYIQVGTLS